MTLHELTIAEAGERLRAREVSSSDLLEAALDRASRTEAQLHAYLTIDREGARAVSYTHLTLPTKRIV